MIERPLRVIGSGETGVSRFRPRTEREHARGLSIVLWIPDVFLLHAVRLWSFRASRAD